MKGESIQLLDEKQEVKLYPYTRTTEVLEPDGKPLHDILAEDDVVLNACKQATTNASNAATSANNAATSASNAATTANNNNTTFVQNETTRQSNENIRMSNESTRVTSETTRQSNETTRIANETARQAELVRLKAESVYWTDDESDIEDLDTLYLTKLNDTAQKVNTLDIIINGIDIQLPSSVENGYMGGDGSWNNNENLHSYALNIIKARGKHISTECSQYAFLTEFSTTSKSTFASGCSRVSGIVNNILVPNDANYLYVYVGASTIVNSLTINDEEDSIKDEISDIKDAIDNIVTIEDGFEKITLSKDGMVSKTGYLISASGIAENASYDSYYFLASRDFDFYIEDWVSIASSYYYLAINLFQNGIISGGNHKGQYRRINGNGSVPTRTSLVHVPAGYIFAISVNTGDDNSVFKNQINASLETKRVMVDDIHLSITQINDVKDNVNYPLIIKHTLSGNENFVRIFSKIPNTTNYYGIEFDKRYIDSSSSATNANSNVWRLASLGRFDSEFNLLDYVIMEGEWECAIKECENISNPYNPKSDFMGGYAHGDEVYSFFNAQIDGKTLDFTKSFEIKGKELRMLCISELNRVGEPNTKLIDHAKMWVIKDGHIEFEQTFKFLQSINVYQGYVTMIPTNRQYSLKSYRQGYSQIFDDAEGHAITYTTNANRARIRQFNDDVVIDVNIDYESNINGDDATYYIANSANPSFNKIYFEINSAPMVVSANSIIKVKTSVDFNISK